MIRLLNPQLTEQDAGTLPGLLFAPQVLPAERKRYFALWHAHLGCWSYQIAAMGIMTAPSVRQIIHAYRQGGMDAPFERVHPGRTSLLTPEILSDINNQIDQGQQTWNSRTLVEYVSEKFGVTIGRTALRSQLYHLGVSWQRTRYVVAGQADPSEQQTFNTDLESVKKGP